MMLLASILGGPAIGYLTGAGRRGSVRSQAQSLSGYVRPDRPSQRRITGMSRVAE